MRGGHFATKKKSSWRERGASTRLFSLFSTIKCLPILRHSNACTMYVDQAVGTEWQPTKEWSEHLRARDGVNKLSIFHLAVSRVWEIAVIGCDVNELLIRVRLDSLKQKVFFFSNENRNMRPPEAIEWIISAQLRFYFHLCEGRVRARWGDANGNLSNFHNRIAATCENTSLSHARHPIRMVRGVTHNIERCHNNYRFIGFLLVLIDGMTIGPSFIRMAEDERIITRLILRRLADGRMHPSPFDLGLRHFRISLFAIDHPPLPRLRVPWSWIIYYYYFSKNNEMRKPKTDSFR